MKYQAVLRFLMASLTGYLAAATALAQNENDILITASASDPNIIAPGSIDGTSGAITVPLFVFIEGLTQFPGVDQLNGDEGFFSVTDGGLLPPGYVPPPPSVDLRFDFRTFALGGATHANFWFWDAVASPSQVEFAPVIDGRTCSFRKTPSSVFNATVNGADLDVTGFVIDRTGTSGQLHKHLTIVLNDADEDLGTPVQPGIYVVAYQLSFGAATSGLIFEVLNGNMASGGQTAADLAAMYINDLINEPPCTGDLNGSGTVDLSDLTVLLSHFGITNATAADGDIDADGDVDLSDLAIMLGRFGTDCV